MAKKDKNSIGYCKLLPDGTLYNLSVNEKYRKQGVATNLLKEAINDGAEYLGCLKSNVKFYVNRRFKVYCVEYHKKFNDNIYYMKLRKQT